MRADFMFGASQSFDIKRKEIHAIDQETKRCSPGAKEGELSRCISRYVDGRLNCSSRYLLSNKSMPACGAEVFDGKDLYSVMYEMFYSQASKIYTLTGCMPSCHQSEI